MKAHELIADPGRWCYRAWAQDWLGNSVHPLSPDAVKWDASGAIQKCYPHGSKEFWLRATTLAKARYSLCLSHLNDRKGHEYVLDVLRTEDI